MHSSKMRTVRNSSRLLGGGWSASVHAGIHPPPEADPPEQMVKMASQEYTTVGKTCLHVKV